MSRGPKNKLRTRGIKRRKMRDKRTGIKVIYTFFFLVLTAVQSDVWRVLTMAGSILIIHSGSSRGGRGGSVSTWAAGTRMKPAATLSGVMGI